MKRSVRDAWVPSILPGARGASAAVEVCVERAVIVGTGVALPDAPEGVAEETAEADADALAASASAFFAASACSDPVCPCLRVPSQGWPEEPRLRAH